jgi:hypothetical protein
MVRPIPYLRIYDASIINYLKYEVLPLYFTELAVDEPLVFDSALNGYVADTTLKPRPTSKGRGWVIFDEAAVGTKTVVDTTQEQTSQVTVVGASSYTIDYIRGRIFDVDTPPTSVSYAWNYVSVVEGWPSGDPPPLPVVAVDLTAADKDGYQLGGGTKDTLKGTVHIFATGETEKKMIADFIYQAFYNRTLSISNWHEGSYIDFDGSYSGFQPTTVSGLSTGAFIDVTANLVGPRFDWSEVNRHRAQVDFVFEVYKDD